MCAPLRLADAFQSTHPVRGATSTRPDTRTGRGISIHAPREGCDATKARTSAKAAISIHAPREGCDDLVLMRQPVRRGISIHAPREGCDNGH